jgi:hypothetical protein
MKERFYSEGEIVQCLVLESIVPYIAKNRYEELVKKDPSYIKNPKDIGLSFKVAIIGRDVKYSTRSVNYHIYENDKIVLPSTSILSYIDFPIPSDIFTDSRIISHSIGISKDLDDKGEPRKMMIMPNPYKNIKFGTEEEKAAKLRERANEWEDVIKEFSNYDDTEALHYLNYKLAQKYGIGQITNEGIEFIKVRPGVSFYSTINLYKPAGSKYHKFSLTSFRNAVTDTSPSCPIDARYSPNNEEIASQILELFIQKANNTENSW